MFVSDSNCLCIFVASYLLMLANWSNHCILKKCHNIVQKMYWITLFVSSIPSWSSNSYASPSSGEVYRDQRVSVWGFQNPVCPSSVRTSRKKKSSWLREYQPYISNWYISGKVFTSTTAWKPKNLLFFQKSSKLNFDLCWRAEITLASSGNKSAEKFVSETALSEVLYSSALHVLVVQHGSKVSTCSRQINFYTYTSFIHWRDITRLVIIPWCQGKKFSAVFFVDNFYLMLCTLIGSIILSTNIQVGLN